MFRLPSRDPSPSLGDQLILLARGEIIAFRVEMTFKRDKTSPTYRVIVKHQGNDGDARVIQNATKALDPQPDPKSLEKNKVVEDLYDFIKEYYVAFDNNKSNIVSTPVFTFVHMVREHIHGQEERLQSLIQGELWPRVQTELNTFTNLENTVQASIAAQRLSSLLRDYDSRFFAPILTSMCNDVGAEEEDMYTADTLDFKRSNPGQPFNCFVRYHFCEYIMKYYLRQYKELYIQANSTQGSLGKIQNYKLTLSEKKKPKRPKKKLSLNEMTQNIIFAGKSSLVDKEIHAYTSYIKKIVTTYEHEREDGFVPRQSSGFAKQAAIEAALSLKVVPAQAPHFHLCLNSQYFLTCYERERLPDALEAVKIAHVRRYRAGNVRNNRTKVFTEDRISLSLAKQKWEEALKEAPEKSKNLNEAYNFDALQTRFISNQVLNEETIKSRLTYLQNEYKAIKKIERKLEAKLPAEAANKDEGEAFAAVPENAPELSSDGGGGESKQQGATDTGEERFEPIDVHEFNLDDDALSEDTRKKVAALRKISERIKKDKKKLQTAKGSKKKDRITVKLNAKKENYLKMKKELEGLLRKLQESSEK